MRSVTITVQCDACEEEIEEEVEGASTVLFTVRGEKRELDLCDECIGKTFLQEARPVKRKREREKSGGGFVCNECGKSFKTSRGLSHHQTSMHG